MENVLDSTKQEIKLIDRGLIYLTGIDKIVRFDSEEFYMESIMGALTVKGEMLEVVKLDTHDGNVKIKGKINSLNYLENNEEDNVTQPVKRGRGRPRKNQEETEKTVFTP